MHMAIGLKTCEGKRYVLSPSLLPRLGAVAVTVTTALDRVTVRVTGEWCGVGRRMRPGEPGFGCGLARESVGRVGFEVGL